MGRSHGEAAERPDAGGGRAAADGRLPGDRRALLRNAALVATGVGVGVAAFGELADVADRKLPLRPGPASATVPSNQHIPGAGQLVVTWAVPTRQNLVALTFDDGPRPEWTSMVLDTLHQYGVPATFFMVGRRVRKYPHVLDGRMDRHEVGNHTWDHVDLSRRGADKVYDDVSRAHQAIGEVTGQAPRLFRPPYGHMGGSTALAATRFNYQVVLWSVQMMESQFPHDSAGHARRIVDRTEPGTILLAHDVGTRARLVALRGLPDMITGLRQRGFEFVTVSELMREAATGT